MAKYISPELYTIYKELIPTLVKRKITLTDLWNIVYDYILDDAEIKVGLITSTIDFIIKDKKYTCSRPSSEIYMVSPSGDVKEENYNILIKDALEYIINKKLLKKRMVLKFKKHTDEN